MLWSKVIGAGAKKAPLPEFVGSTSLQPNNEDNFNSGAEGLDIRNVGQPGDLAVVMFSFSDRPSTVGNNWKFRNIRGDEFITVLDDTSRDTLGVYIGYRFITSSDNNRPYYISLSDGEFYGLNAVASVFSNVSSFDGAAYQYSNNNPNPPLLSTNSSLWVAMGASNKFNAGSGLTAPTGYSNLVHEYGLFGGDYASGAIASKIENLSSENPGTFTFSNNDKSFGATLGFS